MNHNEQYSCIIVDDDPKAIKLLTYQLGVVNRNIIVRRSYTSWSDALDGIRSDPDGCDILFLDISIQGRNGMDLLRSLPGIRSEIIFVTAHPQYALNAFQFSTTGYLLKPVDEIELAKTLERATARIRDKRQAAGNAAGNASRQPSSKIGIPDSKSVNYVDVRNILYLEAVNTYTKVVLSDREIMSSHNMGRFRELLPAHLFYQIHRSYIVNIDHISRYENIGVAVLDNGKELPVAKTSRPQLLALFARVRTGDGSAGK